MKPSAEPATFHLSPQLPAEVRLKIWKTALCTGRRLLTVRLNSVDGDEAGYSVSVDRKPRTNPVWSTCQESRQACYEYFRLPFRVHNGSTLWVNPESDHIFIAEFNIGPLVFLNFISHLKTADPRGIGLLHIAIDILCVKTLAFLRALPATESSSQEAFTTFKQWILGLQSIWFFHLLDADSRLGFGPLSGTRNHTIHGLNRAMPIFPYATDFELFTPDPRPIQARLIGQTVWYDPKRAVSAWVEMEKRLGFGSHEGSKSDEEPTREISHVLAMGRL
ncbi:unnamed protein product [Clonostachys rosea f. rosea IK726]|nr:unnamed protein product [Clonostachys rosea f. rosea IK726]